MRNNPGHKTSVSGSLTQMANEQPLESSQPELFAQKLQSWGIREDDLDSKAVRKRLNKRRLSRDDQYWLFVTAEALARAERAKVAHNPKADDRYHELSKLAAFAARLMTEIDRLFPPPWIRDRARIAALVASLGAFVEGSFNATMMADVHLAKTNARAILQTMKNRRPNQSYNWELLADLTWLASGKRSRPDERTIRRYLDQTPSRSPTRAYWRRNWSLLQKALSLIPSQKPTPPNWTYDPVRDGLPRPIQLVPSRRQRKAIQSFTEVARNALSTPNPSQRKQQKAAQKRN